MIDTLPDNVIFAFCLRDSTIYPNQLERMRKWQILVHVCQRWRGIVFASPRRLELRLSCSYRMPVNLRKNLVVWPVTLPLTVDYPFHRFCPAPGDEDNIVTALLHPGHVDRIVILVTSSLLRKVATLMRKSFPVLTYLNLTWDPEDVSAP